MEQNFSMNTLSSLMSLWAISCECTWARAAHNYLAAIHILHFGRELRISRASHEYFFISRAAQEEYLSVSFEKKEGCSISLCNAFTRTIFGWEIIISDRIVYSLRSYSRRKLSTESSWIFTTLKMHSLRKFVPIHISLPEHRSSYCLRFIRPLEFDFAEVMQHSTSERSQPREHYVDWGELP